MWQPLSSLGVYYQKIGAMWQPFGTAKCLGVKEKICWQGYTKHHDTPSTAKDCNLPRGSRPWLGRNAPPTTVARAVISTTYMQLRQVRHGSVQVRRCGMWHMNTHAAACVLHMLVQNWHAASFFTTSFSGQDQT